MMNENMVDMDPLNMMYDYQNAYNNLNQQMPSSNEIEKHYDINKLDATKNTELLEIGNNLNSDVDNNISSSNNVMSSNNTNNVNNKTVENTNNINSNDIGNTIPQNDQNNGNIVSDITKPFEKGKHKVKKERSSYWSEKITEKDFPFYGCAVCNICYVDLPELDKHIATHKDRITSYDLRVKNQLKKKKLKKEKKKLKKMDKKIKKEKELLDIEIKPEEGYIGNKVASEFNNKNEAQCNSNTSNNASKNDDKKAKVEDNKDLMNLEKIFKCFACQKQFTLSYYLKLHVRSHTDEKPYTCPKCGQSFITASKLGRHDKRFHLQIKYQCRICFRYFSRFEFLTAHFDRKHPDDKIEGEPYDYNAILPYIKELEEELKLKSEQADNKTKEIWTDGWSGPSVGPTKSEEKIKDINGVREESDWKDHNFSDRFLTTQSDSKDQSSNINNLPSSEIKEESSNDFTLQRPIEVIVDEKPFEIPLEKEDVYVGVKAEESEPLEDDDGADEPFKNDSDSDEEYFPENTWVDTKMEDPPSPADTDPLTCGVCSKKISSASYMKIHMRTHTGERPYKCYICKAGFITSSKMNRHVLTHSLEEEVEANIKKEDAEGKGEKMEVDVKAETDDGKKKTKTRKTKGKVKKNSTKLKLESKGSGKKKKRPHACEFCHQRFLHLETLQIHRKSHEGEPIQYKCKFCLSEMEDEASLRLHEASHVGPKPFLCTLCGKCYKKRETMVYHRKHHKADSVFVCSLCSKPFTAKGKLQRHLVTHRRQKYSLRYECPVCAHMFHTKYHVRMHLATHQREGLIVEQNRNEILAMVLQNARKIPKANAVDNPDEVIPPDERSRVCNICGEVFQHFFYLEEHLKNHGTKLALEDEEENEVKKHVCQVCNKSFKLHYYLKLHSFTHTKEKPYICQECGKGFITRGKLKRHLETHAGLKKYQCHVCYKFFTRPSYLRTHVRTIHGTQDYNFRLAQNIGQMYPSTHSE